MEKRWDLGLPKKNAMSLKETKIRTILNNVRSQGHPYVELREDRKACIFFCVLCLAKCFYETNLMDHLQGRLHNRRLFVAKLTLLKPNPWPFSDGVRFFHTSSRKGKESATTNADQGESLESRKGDNSLAIVKYGENLKSGFNEHAGLEGIEANMDLYGTRGACDLLIPGVKIKDEISDLKVRFMGRGLIAARFCGEDDISNENIRRIWCEWLGKEDSDGNDEVKVSDHEFAVVTFSYHYNLGRDLKSLFSSNPHSETESGEGSHKRRKKCFSDPEDMSDSHGASSRLLMDRFDDMLLNPSLISSKTIRKKLRKVQRRAAESPCAICRQEIPLEKDVATLVNVKTGKLACSSRNPYGRFHVYHTSCLALWVLFCEFEMTGRDAGAQCNQSGEVENTIPSRCQIDSVLCPDCQGTGVQIDAHELEKPTITLEERFHYLIKLGKAHKAWMGNREWTGNPEKLENGSIGLHFSLQLEETVQEKVVALKMLRFYRADE